MDITLTNLCDKKFLFRNVQLHFKDDIQSNIFSQKNNKTLKETIHERRYLFLKEEIEKHFKEYLEMPLGQVLLKLKQNNKEIYKSFLNQYGDLSYSNFAIEDSNVLFLIGLYAFSVDGELVYIGRCLDNFKNRINFGYGNIYPKNCYLDGQSTNCNLNALITKEKETKTVLFYVFPMEKLEEIKKLEIDLIQQYNPAWNIQLKYNKRVQKEDLVSSIHVNQNTPVPGVIIEKQPLVIKKAIYLNYEIKQTDKGTIEVFQDGKKQLNSIATLREIANLLSISLYNLSGNPYNTRQLGRILIHKINWER